MADVTKAKSGEDYKPNNRATVLRPKGYESADMAGGPTTSTVDESPRVNDDEATIDGGTY